MVASLPLPVALGAGPFTVQQAREHKVSGTVLQGSRFNPLLRGVHHLAGEPVTLRVWVDAALLVLPEDAVAHHLTGLHLAGVLVGSPWPLRFATTHPHQVRRHKLRVSRLRALPPSTDRIVNTAYCFATACAELDLVDAVTAGDRLLHLHRCTHDELCDALEGQAGRGTRRARRAVGLVRFGSESPRETIVRLMLVLTGLPEPRCNVVVGTATGPIGRGDLVYVGYRLVVEYDGRQHAESIAQWERDIDRLEDFASSSWRHVRVTSARIQRPRTVVRRVYEALVAGGYRGQAPTFNPEWVALFERRTAARRAAQAPDVHSWSSECAV